MKIRKILFSTLFIILCIGMLNYCSGESEKEKSNVCLDFTYNKKNYSIEVEKLAEENNINIEDYPYYLIAKESQTSSSILIYYSQKRLVGLKDSVYSAYRINGSELAFRIKVDSNGSVSGRSVNLSKSYFMVYYDTFIATNHDIFSGKTVAYNKNHGYEYNSSQESEKSCDDVMRVTNETIVYEKAAVNYNEITTLASGNIVKRIAYSVNTVNGHTWDKVVLSNGTEGYVFADNLEIVTGYENINFEYNKKNYNVYFSPSQYGIDIEDYPYYLIVKESQTSSSILIYYSQKRLVGSKDPVYSANRINGSELAFRIKIDSDGSVSGRSANLSKAYIMVYYDTFIATNQDIFSGKTVAYNKNHGYEYNSSQESEKSCDDVVKIINETIVYEKAAVNYNEIMTLASGDIVKRIAYSVNTVNGHTWDKVALSNGQVGYVFADNLEKATEYENVNFEYKKKTYNVYFSPSQYKINIQDYPYYLVVKDASSSILIYYSPKRLVASKDPVYSAYRISGSEAVFRIKIDTNGKVSGGSINLSKSSYFMVSGDEFIASNYDIYKGTDVLWKRNSGYLDADYISNTGLYFSTNSNGYYNIALKAEANIIEGELEYNSVSITEEERENEIKKRDLGIQLAYLAYNAQMKDAANNLLYFLTSGQQKYAEETRNIYSYEEGHYKTGHTAKEILFENAIRDMSEPKETLKNSINSMIEATENIIVKDTDKQPIYCYTEINDRCPAPNLNWFMAVYNYRTRGSAIVSKEGNSYTMNFKYMMIDYYDWEETEGIKNWDPYIGAQTEFSKLNKYGLSRNYTNYDILNYTVAWEQGQRVGNGAIVSGPGLK